MIQDILSDIGIPETASRVYLQLLENGTSSARQIAENLNIPRPSVYDNLKTLMSQGLVVEQEQDHKKLFQVEDVKNVSRLVKTRIEKLQQRDKELKEILPNISKQLNFLEPKIKSYSGPDGLRRAVNDILWYDDIETVCLWPMNEMLEVLGADYLSEMNRKRIRKNINLRVIWPQSQTVDFSQNQFLGVGEKFLRDLRLAPKDMDWNMGYWAYADKVIFISSRKESFGFVVHSRDFAEMIKSQFEMIWPLCEKIIVDSKDTEGFLKTV